MQTTTSMGRNEEYTVYKNKRWMVPLSEGNNLSQWGTLVQNP